MKKILRYLLIITLVSSASCYSQEPIRLSNGEWAPWLSQDLKHYGVASHIVTEAFALEGIDVVYGFFPWARAKTLAKEGAWDGSVVWYYTEERAKDFYFSDPVVATQTAFFHLKSFEFDWDTLDDLKGMEIGATLGTTYSQDFEDAESSGKLNVQRVSSHLLNIRKLLAGRIQLMPMAPEVAAGILRENFTTDEIEKITYHRKTLGVKPLHVIFSKKVKRNKALIPLFNKGLKRLKESGKYDQYLSASNRGEYIIKMDQVE
ncbi:MAG: transporter substrate-binding domain-containing protein [Sedimenticola sp.]